MNKHYLSTKTITKRLGIGDKGRSLSRTCNKLGQIWALSMSM